MFNLSGTEIVVILLLALVVLGPEKLPDALRRAGRTYAELKKMGNSFQEEVKSALDEPMREMRDTADLLRKAADFADEPATPPATAVTAKPGSGNRATPAPSDAGPTPVEAPPAASGDAPPVEAPPVVDVIAAEDLDPDLVNRTLGGGGEAAPTAMPETSVGSVTVGGDDDGDEDERSSPPDADDPSTT
ncbi:MAG: twin-arginine translocase TatA/TatE family subunit [Ilumatobacteraceae bacterium]